MSAVLPPRLVTVAVIFTALVAAACSGDPVSSDPDPNALEYVTPEEVGFSSAELENVQEYYEQIGSAAFMALYDGQVFVAWGNVNRKYWLHSIRKPLLGSLYGIYIARGLIDTTATMEELGIDDIPPSLTPEEKQARVADLLKSRSGVYHPAAAETPEMEAERPERGSHAPGTFFYYNNWDFNVLGTIFEQETGIGIFEAFEQEIAEPIGMEFFRASDGTYRYQPEKSMHPAYPIRMTASDLARFGLLYQKNGRWNGTQIVPQDWIAASTTTYSIDDPETGIGYGMLWYTVPADMPYDLGPAFAHSGVGVHLLYVMPTERLVFVNRVNTDVPWTITTEEILLLVAMVIDARMD